MKILAMVLMKCKSFKERQEKLSESIDHLSYNFPDVFAIVYREMKRREIESNNPNKISKWLGTSNSYVKLHEALILVKSNNDVIRENYVESLKLMLNQTIDNRTNIDETLKICRLIEKHPHLKIIHDKLKSLIQQVYQLNDYKHSDHKKHLSNNLLHNNFESVHANPWLNIKFDHLQHTPVWPTMLQPPSLKLDYGFPNFNFNYHSYDGNRPTLNFPQSFFNLTIIDQDMDGTFSKWLHYLKLHKYQWFFNGLSYLEIECIDEENIEEFIAKVNQNSITKGAQKKICISTKTLRDRKQKLEDLKMSLDLNVTLTELCEFIVYMREILHVPIPNKHCVVGDQLQQDIVCVMEKLFHQLLEKLIATNYLVAQSLLGNSINAYLECTMLLTSNQVFMREQVEKTLFFAGKLKCKVRGMPRNFY